MSKEKKNNIEKNIECPKRKKKKLKKIEKNCGAYQSRNHV